MCRGIIAFFSILLFSVLAFPQLRMDNSSRHARDSDSPSPETSEGTASRAPVESRISAARLRVPPKVRHLFEKALHALRKQKRVEARRDLEKALKLFPSFPEALTLSGTMEMNEQQWTSAEQNLRAAIQSDPEYVRAYVVLAGLYNAQGRFDEALHTAQLAVSLGPRSWDLSYELARALIGKGEYGRALSVSDAGLRKKHGTLLHIAKAHALAGLGSYAQAQAELRAYLRFEPSGEGVQDARNLLNQIQQVILR